MPVQLHRRRHPEYERLLPHWTFLTETYEGSVGWLEANIFQYHKESTAEWKERVARAFRDNMSRDVVEIWTSHLYKQPITRSEKAPDTLQAFWKKATKGKGGRSIDEFMREASDKSGAVSPVYLVVDMPTAAPLEPGQVRTKKQAMDEGLVPYVYCVYPQDVLDFGLDDQDEFTWLLMKEYSRDDADPFDSSGDVETRYRLWTLDKWQVYREKANGGIELVDEGDHHLGRVPVVRLTHKDGRSPYEAISLLEEIAYKDRAVANHESRLDAILCEQTFSQLFIPDAGLMASTEKDAEGRRRKMVKMGVNRIVLFNDKAQHPPMFLSPDASQGTLIMTVIEGLREQILEDALLDSQGGSRSTDAAKTATEAAFDFEKLNGALADKAKNLEGCERELAMLVCLWTEAAFDPEAVNEWVQYPRKFQVKALKDELEEATMLKALGNFGATFWEQYLGRLVKKLLPDVPTDELAVIVKEMAEGFAIAMEQSRLAVEGAQLANKQLAQGVPQGQEGPPKPGQVSQPPPGQK